ncbi:hypothetical protein Sgly_2614 [Syntrophobotulus glycolicus DSM 8271]|uniref:SON protein n=1 Tax=Syntrophobotulus glycolicus (strain DSM 8271 / FlGlyR) TaxID=645991 RepID=F0SWQ3_SYNGF|nr:hypothetical protein [Syntrophobotulus glycolicus]ADY56893.1 hypothetical protein Sgly_2614 [Syntrophobotulus glycolicus DSM 8271]
MFTECREHLIEKLKGAGIRSKPYTSMKKLRASQEAHIGAVLFEEETFDRSGAKKLYSDQTGAQHKRRKVFSRETTFSVIIGDPDPKKTEEFFEAFLRALDKGIYIDGNYTPIEVVEAEWVDEDDSILKARVAVNVKVKFMGGVYKDTDFAKLTDVEVESVIKGKETQDGE